MFCRLFFANYTSSLLAVNSTLLAYALGAAAIAGAVALALYFLSTQPAASGYGSYNSHYQSRGFRSADGESRTAYVVSTEYRVMLQGVVAMTFSPYWALPRIYILS